MARKVTAPPHSGGLRTAQVDLNVSQSVVTAQYSEREVCVLRLLLDTARQFV
jgi:hypothetical protein